MFKVLDLPTSGPPVQSLDVEAVGPPASGAVRWVDLLESDEASLSLLQERFGFHPLEIEDCATFELRSKMEEYPDLFVVIHAFTADANDPSDIQIHEVHAFVGESYLVTVHDNPVPAAENVWRRVAAGAAHGTGSGWLLYLTTDAMVDAVFPMLGTLTGRLDEIEETLLSGGVGSEADMTEIFRIKRTLVAMRRIVRGVRDVVHMLSRRTTPPMTERTALYFRDVHDHALRCAETIDEALALAEYAMDTYQTAVTNRTNEIVRKLTIFSVIFLPLGFITGFWGQNFGQLPMNNPAVFWAMLGLTVTVPIVLLVWFWRRDWL